MREGPNLEEGDSPGLSRVPRTTEEEKPATARTNRDGIPKGRQRVEEQVAMTETMNPETTTLIERLVERENMNRAYKRVKANKGSAGVDGMTVDELKGWVHANWDRVKGELLVGRYRPQAVRGVEIPKASGWKRQLGIPTVMDRLIQQALHQVLSPIFEPGFSEHSYGFRPGKSAHDAIRAAREYQLDGKRWVVDIDLAKFFDEVNHDILMARIAEKVQDKNVLRLIRRYLQAGILKDGVVWNREKGTPQGGNLSPLLSNIMLDALDKELEKRGLTFCRYADDCNIYVRSERAGQRVMASITKFIEGRLKLKVNVEKSAVARPWQRKFLGYTFTNERKVRLNMSKAAVDRFKQRIRDILRAGRGRNLGRLAAEELTPFIRGWIQYYSCVETKQFAETLDGWVRRKLHCTLWRQWKRPWTRKCRLQARGIPEMTAIRSVFNQRGPWWNSGAQHMSLAFPKKFFDGLGLVSMLDILCRSR